jgi:CubicO group peptidase (beta-lactamase class C family)
MKIFRYLLIILVSIGLAYGVIYLWMALPVISAYGAKNLCSCVFISGRSAEEVIDSELNYSLIKYGSFEIKYEDSSATGSVFGLAERKAVYRGKLGCTLVIGTTEEALRSQPGHLVPASDLGTDTAVWPRGNKIPDAIPVNTDKLKTVINDAFGDTYGENTGTRGVVVAYQGQLIAEQYREPFTYQTPQMGWSMTKSVTNALVGIMAREGAFKMSDKAPIEDWQNDPRSGITFDDLMRMSSGLQWEEKYEGVSTATKMLFKSYSTGEFAARQPLAYEPGTHWYYSSGTTNILSYIIKQQLSQEEYFILPHRELFNKLGMTTAVIEPDASGTYVGSSFMYASPRDWTKFALLYLNDGIWNDEHILPEGWVDYSTRLTEDSNGKYGAHFWLNKDYVRFKDAPEDTYVMSGFQGQNVIIIPSKELIITRLAYDPEEKFDVNGFVRDVLRSIDKVSF